MILQNGQQTAFRPDAHSMDINALISVGSEIWSGSDDGTIKMWTTVQHNNKPPSIQQMTGLTPRNTL